MKETSKSDKARPPKASDTTEEDIRFAEEVKRITTEYPSILQIASLSFKESESHSQKMKPMVRCRYNIKMGDLFKQVLHKRWHLNDPRIVVFILSNMGSINNWNNEKQIKSFQKGLTKAAESTDMWIISNGLDLGSTTVIGDAVSNYTNELKYKNPTTSDKTLSKLNFIGIADQSVLKYLPTITESTNSVIQLSAESPGSDDQKYVLNENLTHYMLIEDQTLDKSGVKGFINKFMTCLAKTQREGKKGSDTDEDDTNKLTTEKAEAEVPVISIVIKGGFECSRIVLQQIKDHIPVVVLRGSGGLADLLSFVDIEIRDRCLDKWDSEFAEQYLTPELNLKLMEMYPKYQNNSLLCKHFRNRILDSIRLSRDNGQNCLTVINMFDNYSCNLENLTEYLMLALIRSQRKVTKIADSAVDPIRDVKPDGDVIRKDLKLCVDWNCPEVAKREVLSKDPAFPLNNEKRLFEASLIRTNRLQFIDLFLSQKFKLRTFVSIPRINRMFRKIHSSDFFRTVCWESILIRNSETKQSSKNFITRDLNWLFEYCTGIPMFFNEEELISFSAQEFPNGEREAERKSLVIIVFWALLGFRKQLVRILWRHSDQPIHLALIIAMTYERLSWKAREQVVVEELKEESKLFISFASKVLDICHKESHSKAEQMLNECNQHFLNKTPIDLADLAAFKSFFTHRSCQKYLEEKFNGNIIVNDIPVLYLTVPTFIKLLVSAYLFLPALYFIRLPTLNLDLDAEEDEEEDDDRSSVKAKETDVKQIGISEELGESNLDRSPSDTQLPDQIIPNISSVAKVAQAPKVSFILLIQELWSAPITKFWNYQFFYTLYLSIFSVAVLYPRCGHNYLDSAVIIWTVLLILDDIRQAYLLKLISAKISLPLRSAHILFKTFFVSYYVYTRPLSFGPQENPSFNYWTKGLMCLALLHAYYFLITIFLPISATLGPLIYRLKIMIFIDFLNFIRLSILVMISFGVVIQATLYPDLDIDTNLFKKLFHRALISLWITPIGDLDVSEKCKSTLSGERTSDVCYASDNLDSTCPVDGYLPYVFMITYFILLKQILSTLLFALFASSASSLVADTDTIWKYQRYALVNDFILRTPIPPPLNIFYYLYLFCHWSYRSVKYLSSDPKHIFDIFNIFKDLLIPKPENRFQKKSPTDEDHNYFKLLASQIYEEHLNQLDSGKLVQMQWERTKANSEELENERRTLRQMKGKVSEMERSIRQTFVYLETIKHLVSKKTSIEMIAKKELHSLSRLTPYPFTIIQRYPVPDRYVSWDVMWTDYDPVAYTKPKHEFPVSQQQFVDEDTLRLIELQLHKTNKPLPTFDWNRVSVNAAGITTDRQSWELFEDKPKIYKLEDGIPVNPYGRTGLRGRGALPRWGPNHYVMLLITRLTTTEDKPRLEVLVEKLVSNTTEDKTTLEDKPTLEGKPEFEGKPKDKVLIRKLVSNKTSLMVRFISGEISYQDFEYLFITTDSQHKNWTQSQKMIQWFKSFEETPVNTVQPNAEQRTPNKDTIPSEPILKGYFDDPLNTDQAWREIELWHFHYVNQSSVLNNNIKECLEWREITESLVYVLNVSQSNVIQGIVTKLNVNIS